MVLQKLNTSNFEVLNKNQMVRIKGGEQTRGGTLPDEFEYRYDPRPDGGNDIYYRVKSQSYSSDEIIDGQECYYGLAVSFGPWHYQGWEPR